ncbi:Hypothetical predicted protein [Octopus vulgaris]|uniref:Uncharacterized protein n=1 Tax=Octopus vulgaris TaxID=6645 RepID=A0AA36B9S8_OCTVU|nr:Hypothetical predicted protein [Octopus vulgaris]
MINTSSVLWSFPYITGDLTIVIKFTQRFCSDKTSADPEAVKIFINEIAKIAADENLTAEEVVNAGNLPNHTAHSLIDEVPFTSSFSDLT